MGTSNTLLKTVNLFEIGQNYIEKLRAEHDKNNYIYPIWDESRVASEVIYSQNDLPVNLDVTSFSTF